LSVCGWAVSCSDDTSPPDDETDAASADESDSADSDTEDADTGSDDVADATDSSDSADSSDARDTSDAADASDADSEVFEPIILDAIEGDPDDSASENVPLIWFPAPEEDDWDITDIYSISVTEALIAIAEDATVAEINELLTEYDARIVGALPGGRVHLWELPFEEVVEMTTFIDELAQDPAIDEALLEFGVGTDALPPTDVDPTRWEWDVPDYPAGPADHGNWGLELIRAPQMWNFDDYATRERSGTSIDVGVVDSGFTDNANGLQQSTHPAFQRPSGGGAFLSFASLPGGNQMDEQEHGTFVAGVIGASWVDGAAVTGIDPWVNHIHGRGIVWRSWDHTSWGRQLSLIARLISTQPNIRAINNSYGFSKIYARADRFHGEIGSRDGSFQPANRPFGQANADGIIAGMTSGDLSFREFGVDTDNDNTADRGFDLDGDGDDDTWSEVMNFYGNVFRLQLDSNNSGGKVFIVASAGNAGQHYQSVDNSPMGNLAFRHGGRWLSVESVNSENRTSSFSSRGASIAAPGECVRSTELLDLDRNYDSSDCDHTDTGDASYATNSGTSFAAPHVSGLIAALYHLDPELSLAQVRQLITQESSTQSSPGARRIDAFAAAIAIDTIRGDDTLQLALVDVDDGTPDGNQRIDDSSGRQEDHERILTDGNRRGDGLVSMADFRAFRDAQLAALEEGDELLLGTVLFDGEETHFKHDYNFDGCVGDQPVNPPHPGGVIPTPSDCSNAPGESVFSRYDFNGNGRLDHETSDYNGNDWRDIDVLADLWVEGSDDLTEGWLAADLPGLLPRPDGSGGSADLIIRTREPVGVDEDYDEVRITVDRTRGERSLLSNDEELIWTVPAGSGVGVHAMAYNSGAEVEALCPERGDDGSLNKGEDRRVYLVPCGESGARHTEDGVVAAHSYGPESFATRAETLESGSATALSIDCPELEVGDHCNYHRKLPNAYARGTISATITRNSATQYTIEASTFLNPIPAPLLSPPEGGPGCGGKYEEDPDRFVWCQSWTEVPVELQVNLQTAFDGNTTLGVRCHGTAETTVDEAGVLTGWTDPFFEMAASYGDASIGVIGEMGHCLNLNYATHDDEFVFDRTESIAPDPSFRANRSVQLRLRSTAYAAHWVHTETNRYTQSLDASVQIVVQAE